MHRRWVILAGVGAAYLAVVNITNRPPAYVYKGLGKQLWVATGLHYLSHPCYNRVENNLGVAYSGVPTDQCFRMSRPQRMRGVWLDAFEDSRFLPGDARLTRGRLDGENIWLNVEQNRIPGLFRQDTDETLRVFEIDFVGRKTRFAGEHGHMGGSEHEIIVDRLISARELRPEPWAASLNDYWRRRLNQPHW